MKFLLTTAALFFTVICFAQNYTGSFTFRSKLYSIKSERQESGSFKITIEETDDNKSDFTIKPLKMETFDVAFKGKLSSILPSGETTLTPAESTELTTTAKSLFFSIVAESLKEGMSDAPIAGKLTIAKEVGFYDAKDDNQEEAALTTEKVSINDIEIEFYEGYIETIKVNATKGEKQYRFENQYGIGFSTRKNYYKLKNIRLFDFKNNKYIKVGDLLDYDYKVKVLTRDFSPGNQALYSYGGQKVELRKDETSKLLEAIIYSDFIGIDKEKPNGLIQTEVAKRINLYPTRIQTAKWMSWLSKGFGFFQYIRPAVTISKIEENNRFLQPKRNDSIFTTTSGSDSLKTEIVSTPIEILNYQNTSLGLDLNILFLDNPDIKYHFYLNGGFRFGRTAIRDSLRTLSSQTKIETTGLVNEFGISYFTFYPEAILQYLPEERVSLIISDKLQFFSSAFNNPVLVSYDKKDNIEDKLTKWINTFEIMGYFKTGENGKLFGRYRFNSQIGNVKQQFHQFQLGYSFYILKKN
ncbi:MAG TPA: hypothetical protein PK110_16300 [Niabella sp.]|nr:hypothetical protein [Niabella sp.]HRP33307.1 hypothetical protein [Agriterribacter sp.]